MERATSALHSWKISPRILICQFDYACKLRCSARQLFSSTVEKNCSKNLLFNYIDRNLGVVGLEHENCGVLRTGCKAVVCTENEPVLSNVETSASRRAVTLFVIVGVVIVILVSISFLSCYQEACRGNTASLCTDSF